MIFQPIEQLLLNGWSIIPIKLLNRDQNTYSILAIQPSGKVKATPWYVGPEDTDLAHIKFINFVKMANMNNVDLLISPEYSCPWQTIEESIRQEILPHEGDLWVFGCASILPDEIEQLKKNFPQVMWLVEPINKKGKQVFYNPLCYIFWAKDNNNNKKIVIAIQFKSTAMGGDVSHLERDYMIPGTRGYILHNDNNSINLISLICSDALVFEEKDLPDPYDKPYLVLHPQLNLNPRHIRFKAYRSDVFARNGRTNYEFICVNWAKNFVIHGKSPSPFGASAYYFKEIDLVNDEAVNLNHKKGLYYTKGKDYYSHIYFFNYNEHIFYFQTTKIRQDAVSPPQRSFSGPEMLQLYAWDSTKCEWILEIKPDDGFDDLCCSLAASTHSLFENSLTPIDKERIILLSTGQVSHSSREWFKVDKLPSFQVKEDEIVNRLTVVQDPNEDSLQQKCDLLNRFCDLKNLILPNNSLFPLYINDLKSNNEIRYPIKFSRSDGKLVDSYIHNVCQLDGTRPATAAYIGRSTIARAQRIYSQIDSMMDEFCSRRIIVWYQDSDGSFKYYTQNDLNDYSRENEPLYSIIKED